ncbi:hypothetical protein SAMN05216210_2536 [Halopseudomonas salegens]|uniref:Uncharacterized protein n=1 Tax=Halopseudomonas salegens TaxID=1434072 RepID=A0A1H2GTD7_9GAMM|nr:hypothetical protein SAMN05216210_2536 [Halopseudomonas salegens]
MNVMTSDWSRVQQDNIHRLIAPKNAAFEATHQPGSLPDLQNNRTSWLQHDSR